MKLCQRCRKEKPDTEFTPRKYKGKVKLNSYCHRCNADLTAISRNNMKKTDPHMFWCHSTLRGHKFWGYTIKITKEELREFIRDKLVCNICGCELSWFNSKGKLVPNSPTLDRVNCEQEINISNIQIICAKCNRVKQNMTMKEMLEYCKNFVKKFGETDG